MIAAPDSDLAPADWLRRWGIRARWSWEGNRLWAERAGVGDLAALRARSRAVEPSATRPASAPSAPSMAPPPRNMGSQSTHPVDSARPVSASGQAVPQSDGDHDDDGGTMNDAPRPTTARPSRTTGEDRTFPPSPEFTAQAVLGDPSIYDRAEADPEAFWAAQARDLITWDTDFHTTLGWELPFAKWFVGGPQRERQLPRPPRRRRPQRQGRHPLGGRTGRHRAITYAELLADVSRFANVLKSLGIGTGDRVCIYLPMIPEAVVAMLACARLGAAHSWSSSAASPRLAGIDRIDDAGATVVITSDGGYRPANRSCSSPTSTWPSPGRRHRRCAGRRRRPLPRGRSMDRRPGPLVARPGGGAVRPLPPVSVDAEHPVSCSTPRAPPARPKGIMHTSGGYLTQVAAGPTSTVTFDLHPTPTSTGAPPTSAG